MKTLIKILPVCMLGLAVLPVSAVAKSEKTKTEARTAAVAKPRIEVCFVLDTTGSMSGLIEGAKQKIWSIANEMISAKPTPEIRVGLIGYRDRGDEYVVNPFDLTTDIDAVYGNLRGFSAAGGGDMPESVNEALEAAVTKMSWSADRSVLKIIFLVGDAPPHMDYANAPKYPEICQAAVKKDLIINTVQCGNIAQTVPVWTEIAKLSEGSYAAIAQSGGMVAMATPMDAELAALNRKVGATLVAYGDVPLRRSIAAKQAVSEVASAPVIADRLAFNMKSGKAVQGDGELLDSLARGSLKLETIQKDQLPAEWQTFSDGELKTEIAKKQKERSELQAQILKLSKERDDYIATERKKLASTGQPDSFDAKINATIHEQAARKGILYGKD